jgi:hypothetical protein
VASGYLVAVGSVNSHEKREKGLDSFNSAALPIKWCVPHMVEDGLDNLRFSHKSLKFIAVAAPKL